jgi:hypothetical protein
MINNKQGEVIVFPKSFYNFFYFSKKNFPEKIKRTFQIFILAILFLAKL